MTLVQLRQAHAEFEAVVRDAMSYGPDPVLSEKYRRSRASMQDRYRSTRESFDRVWTTVGDPRRFPGQHTDPFESLLSSATLEGLLNRDARQIQRDLEDIATAFDLCEETEVSIA